MSIIIARVDERLIHGQVATAWIKRYPVDTVAVVDDASASDQLRKMLLEMALSGTAECKVTNLSEAPSVLKALLKRRVFLVASSPSVILSLLKAGVSIPHINIGGMYAKEGRKQYFRTVFLTDVEKAEILELKKYPCSVEYRAVPQDDEVDIIAALEK
jgi:mannose/fructose/N-acetylgalactosamine-specific phosphotransferase system component IIB